MLIAIVRVSCSKDFLKEELRGQLITEGFGKNEAELNIAITALYNLLTTIGYGEYLTGLFCRADDLTTRAGSNKEHLRDFNMFFASKDKNEYNNEIWRSLYEIANSANFVINNYQLATETSQTVRDNAAGQAHCLRAFAYFMLTRLYMDIPMVTTNIVDKNIKKTSTADIYNLIVEDLKKAEKMLPDKWASGKEVGVAVTKRIAKSLLASTYLHMAGFPLMDISKYALAAQIAKEVLDSAGTYVYSLLPKCQDLWLDMQRNDELILGIFYSHSAGSPNFRAPMMGKSEDEGGWDEYFTEINFFNRFPDGPRKDATFKTKMKTPDGINLTWEQTVQKHPYYNKMTYANGSNPINYYDNYQDPYYFSFNSNRTTVLLRFAEVKLIYAEEQAMSANLDAAAYQQINDVRMRAGLPNLIPGLSQSAFRDSVVAERAWEFAGPENGQRWFDLVRLEMVESANSNRHINELPLQRNPTKQDYFAPIPFREKLLNPNL